MDKRIVLEYTTGAHKGLHQILGTEAEMKATLGVTQLPSFIPEAQFLDHVGAVNLIRVRRSYVHYRELITPALAAAPARTFNPDQR